MQSRRGIYQALLSAALFGAATPVSKPLLARFSPQTLAGLLYLGAALALAPRVIRRARTGAPVFPADPANRRRLAGAIVFGGILGPVALLMGLDLAKAASVAMWLNLETAATACLGVLFFREHLGKWTWTANAAVAAAGAMLAWEGGDAGWRGAALVAAAAVCWGLDNNWTALVDGVTASDCTFWKGLVAGATNLTLGLARDGAPPHGSWWWIALAVGAVSYGVSIALYIAAAQSVGAVRSQMIFAASPAFGVAGAALFLSEGFSGVQWAAAAILVGANVLLLLDRHAHEHVHEEAEHEHEHRHDDGHHDHLGDADHAGLAPSARHTHRHRHGRLVHSHAHWPDLHHRHTH